MNRRMPLSGRGTLLALTAAVTIAVGGAAQAEPAEPMREAAMEAVLSNPDVQARWHAFRAAGEQQREARGGFLPEIDLNARTGYQRQRYDDSSIPDRTSHPQGIDITLTQMLYDGFGVSSDVNRLGEVQRVRYFELREATEETAQEAVQAFADVQRQRTLVQLAQENYDAHKETYDQIMDQAEQGVGRGSDLEQASGRLALADSNLLTERQNLHDVTARYYRVVGMAPPEETVDLVGVFADEPLPDTVQDAVSEAITSSPAMFAANRSIEAAQLQRKVARSRFHPRLDFRIRHAYENDVLERQDVWVHDTLAQFVLSWNLYRGGSDQARLRRATDEFNGAREDQEVVCRNVRQTLSVAYNDIRSLESQLRFLRQHRDSSDRVRTAYRQQFQIGQRSLLDLLDTENEYFEASRALVNAQHDYELAKARALNGMGRLLEYLEITRADVPEPEELGLGDDDVRLDPETLCPPDAPKMMEATHESIFR